MKLTIIVDGGLKARVVDKVINTHIVMLDTDDPELESARIYGIQPVEPIVTDGIAFLAGFAVVPFKGDGKYTIEKGSIRDAAAAAQGDQQKDVDKSSVQVQWWPSGDIAKETFEYLRRAKPCTVRVADKGTSGELTCPEVTHEGTDTRFSLEMRWDPA